MPNPPSRWPLVFALLSTLAAPGLAIAHSGAPAVAWVNDPDDVGVIADREFTFTWIDSDQPIPTGTATIDFYYTARRPPTFQAGDLPELLEGEPIVLDIREADRTNSYTWDTSKVPAGSYLIWSRVNEPPEEMSAEIISFSPGVLTIAHEGDELHPAVMLTTPDSPFRFADISYTVRWRAFDPDGSARLTLEAFQPGDDDVYPIAEDLPAEAEGSVEWLTLDLPEGDYMIRAVITDARGLSFTNWSRYFLLVTHFGPPRDAGVRNDAGAVAPTPDAGARPDAGEAEAEEPGCGCTGGPASAVPSSLMLVLLLALYRRRR